MIDVSPGVLVLACVAGIAAFLATVFALVWLVQKAKYYAWRSAIKDVLKKENEKR